MRELVVLEFMTLDAVVQAPGHAAEDIDGGFAQGGWTQPYMVDHREFGAAEYAQAGDFLFGRRTYEIWQPHWSTITDIARDDLERAVQQLKSQPGGPIVVPGSGQLVHALTAANLVDRYQVWIHPVAVGSGKRLFTQPVPRRLIDSTSTPTGVTILEFKSHRA